MPPDTSIGQAHAATHACAPKRLTRARASRFRKFMETIVFLERDTLRASLRGPAFEHVWRDYDSTRPEEIEERLKDATVAVVNKLPLGADLLARLPSLRLIAVAATGTDNVDLEFCRAHGIEVRNVRGYARETLPEHVFMLIARAQPQPRRLPRGCARGAVAACGAVLPAHARDTRPARRGARARRLRDSGARRRAPRAAPSGWRS